MKEQMDMVLANEEEHQSGFKARLLNKKIFSSVSKLPEVGQKELTTF